MSANVERMMYVGQVPWHGLGKLVSENIKPAEAIIEAGADFEVGLSPLHTVLTNLKGEKIVETVDHRAIYRKDTNKVLGVAGPHWEPLQNKSAFDWFIPFCESGEVKLHTAGVLDEGRRVWVLAQISRPDSEIVKGDAITKYILLSNPHIHGKAIMVGFTPIRVVCVNTLAMAISNKASKLIRVRHTGQAKTNLDSIRETINVIDGEFEATAEMYRSLARKQINRDDLKKYVKIVLGHEDTPEKDLSTRTKNTIDEVMKNFDYGKGAKIPGVSGTLWGAYNAYTEYLTWEQGRNNDNRLNNLWFGTNVEKNREALDVALAMV